MCSLAGRLSEKIIVGFVDGYIHALSLQDDARHSQSEPHLASALACAVPGDLGALLHCTKYAGTTAQDMAKAIAVRDHIEKELVEAIRNKCGSRGRLSPGAGRRRDCDRERQCPPLATAAPVDCRGDVVRPLAPLGVREHGVGCLCGHQALPLGTPALAGALVKWRYRHRLGAGCWVCS